MLVGPKWARGILESPTACVYADIPMSSAPIRPNALRLNAADNVVIAMQRLVPGEAVSGEAATAAEAIPSGHKLATALIPAGETVRKYGQVIGVATADIRPGSHVHTHNLAVSALREGANAQSVRRQEEPRFFEGYRRRTGKVGVRNYVGVLTSVNCSATVARHIAEAAERKGLLADHPYIDGVVPITHTSGCGMAGSGEGYEVLRRTLWGTAANPNFGGGIARRPWLRGRADRPVEERFWDRRGR